jgi:hypothetical protein
MKAIDIYNFRRDLNASNFINSETPCNIISELLDLKNDIDFITNGWTRVNLEKIKYEKDKTL